MQHPLVIKDYTPLIVYVCHRSHTSAGGKNEHLLEAVLGRVG